MPKTEAEIARPYQIALDKARTELADERKKYVKEIKEVREAQEKEKELFLSQAHEMKGAIQSLPEEVKKLKEELAEVREHHGQLLTDLDKEVTDHKHTEDKLKGCLDQLLAVDEVRIDMQNTIEELKKQIPTGNEPGRPRLRRSRRS